MTDRYHTTDFVEACINAPLIPQRSEAWFKLRETRITGSMCDTLLGNNRFNTWDQVVAEKAGMPVEFKGNEATQHGIDNEDTAIRLYEERTGRKVFELGLTQHPTVDILAHSPDGISVAANDGPYSTPILLEVKCPFSREIKPGVVPKYYMGQLQLGLEVFDLPYAHFVQYKPYQDGTYTLDITTVYREMNWLDNHIATFTKFWDEVDYWKRIGWRRHPYYQKQYRDELFQPVNQVNLFESDEEVSVKRMMCC